MLTRVIAALVGIALFLALCFGGAFPYAAATVILAGIAAHEWNTAFQKTPMLDATDRKTRPNPLALNSLLTWLGAALPYLAFIKYAPGYDIHGGRPGTWALLLPVAMFGLLLARVVWAGDGLGPLRRWYGVAGILYIGALLTSFVLLRNLGPPLRVAPFGATDRGAWLMLFVAVCVWATDTSAFFVGIAIGRHKLAPILSPKKTIEGAIGGLLGAMLVGAAFGTWIHLPLRDGLVIGIIAGLAGQAGDLFESALKRELGIKDFGSIMPGHGGALDRFDSLLFVAPLAYLYLAFLAI